MIKSLELINHESHKATNFDFTPGLNVFVGPTDAGKSSAFRGMYWVLNNRPLGDSMRPRFWEGETKATIEFTNPDAIVSRIKGKSVNDYQLNDADPINAGSGPPPNEIADIIMMDDVNFQTQVDRAFLMFESPGERGRILNRVAGLDEIDKAIDNSRRDEQRLNREYQQERSRLVELGAEMESYSDIHDQEQRIMFCERLNQFAIKSENVSRRLQQIITQVADADVRLKVVEALLLAEKGVESLSWLVSDINKAELHADDLKRITSRIKKIHRKLVDSKHVPAMERGIAELIEHPDLIEEHEYKANKLNQLVRKLKTMDDRIVGVAGEIEWLENEMPENCPTCGASL